MDAAVRGASTPDLAPSIAAKLGKLIGRARAKPGTAESAGHGKPAFIQNAANGGSQALETLKESVTP